MSEHVDPIWKQRTIMRIRNYAETTEYHKLKRISEGIKMLRIDDTYDYFGISNQCIYIKFEKENYARRYKYNADIHTAVYMLTDKLKEQV